MKNFKKVLALVLAIATLLSFATVASAKTADFADAKDVKNVEAVDVLSYIKVLEGYPADNTFKPAKNITREEAAKIIAIFANKSTDISSLYTSANPFADMKGRWGESYVAYGYRAGIIAGKNATSFVPKANVKGTEFLKMVLVVLGYDQNKEGLVGSSWAVNTLELAKAKKLLAGLGKDFNANAALTRDQAAQIMLNALKAEKVVYGQTITNLTWNAKTGYWMTTNTTANAVYVSPNGAVNNYEHKLLAADFNLTLTETQDKWGRPTHTWNKGTATIGEYVDSDKLVKSYYTAVTECDIASDAGIKTEKIYPIFVNGQTPVKYNVQATDTVAKLGAQGRLTEVYEDRIVMIDTFLAKVDNVTAATFDAAGHLKTPATITLAVYDSDTGVTTPAAPKTVVLTNGSTNYTYAKGDYVLVNSYTTGATVTGSGSVIATATTGAYAEIAGKAESFEGAQTVIWFNAGKHTVDGTAYDDAAEFHLNKNSKKIAKMTWFKDLYGNLIGVTEIEATYAYGVITAIRNAGDFAAFGASKTYANVKYVDGTDNTVTVNSIKPLGFTNAQKPVAGTYNAALMTFTDIVNGTFSVSYDSAQNEKNDPKDIVDGHLFRIETLADGTVNLVEMGPNYTGTQTMIARGLLVVPATTVGATTTVKVDDATKFLLRSKDKVDGAYVYTAITGVKDFAKYSNENDKPTVDAVVSLDGYASVVYLVGDSDAAKAKGFSYIVGSTYNAQLKTDADAIKYYEVILATKTEDGTANEVLKVKATDTALLNTLIASSNYGKLFYIETTGGYVSGVQKVGVVDSTNAWGTQDTTNNIKYSYFQYNNKVDTSYAVGYDNKTLKNAAYGNNILTLGAGNSFYVVADTVVVGDLNVLTDKVIYVIGNEDGIASKVYVVDNDASQGSTVPGKATLTYVAKLYNKNGDYVKDIVMGTQEVTFTNPSALSETFTPSYTVAHGYMTAPVAGFTGTATASVDAAVLNGYQLTGNDAQSVTVVSGEAKTVTWMLIAK
ncbi:MAG: hypothetical protein DBX57_02205 [Clostridia bacterium]|nr:MAG: hypothetical protein DBX57_02205 [Clostridia bacterium]